MRSMSEAWRWRADDKILHCLPLHHIHGIVNALYCPHHNGAHVRFLGGHFSPRRVWEALVEDQAISVFMGVPTMYAYLLSYLDEVESRDAAFHAKCVAAARRLRLAISGSSACPVPIMQRWQELSGQLLLERYGMTETGMILSNPYETGGRLVGTVGKPMPHVEVALSPEGELLVRSKYVAAHRCCCRLSLSLSLSHFKGSETPSPPLLHTHAHLQMHYQFVLNFHSPLMPRNESTAVCPFNFPRERTNISLGLAGA